MIELSDFSIFHLVSQFPAIEPLVADTAVTDIMIVTRMNPSKVRIFYERRGRLEEHDATGVSLRLVESLVFGISRSQGEDPNAKPLIDARLADGSRVALSMPPASPSPAITIRRFSTDLLTAGWLVSVGSLPPDVLSIVSDALSSDHNVLVSGGTSSGKTTLLNAFIQLFPESARFIVVEDTIELRVEHPNSLRLEARDLKAHKITHRDLIRHALRHRPDHIVIGEIRGEEAADVLQALNTGHGGSLSTIHANSASDALFRIASCAMQAMGGLPWHIVCRQVATAFDYVVHQHRRPDRTRGVRELIRVHGYDVPSASFQYEEVWPAGRDVSRTLPSSAVVPAGTPESFAPPRALMIEAPVSTQLRPVPSWQRPAPLVVPADDVDKADLVESYVSPSVPRAAASVSPPVVLPDSPVPGSELIDGRPAE